MEEPNFWIELLKTFGLPTVLLFVCGYILYETQTWIRTKLTDLVEKCIGAITENTSALKSNTEMAAKVHETLNKRQAGSI